MAGRPYNVKDVQTVLNGDPNFLGKIVSGGTAVDNHTTASPFNDGTTAVNGVVPPSLAGKMLLLQCLVAGGYILSSTATPPTVTDHTGANPGVYVGAGERVEMLMGSDRPYLQWLPAGGAAANLMVWELR